MLHHCAALVSQYEPHRRVCMLQNGAVINLSSLSAIQVNPDYFAYNVAKAAMDHVTKTQARKYTKLGVRVNSVNPGYVRPSLIHLCCHK